MRLDHAYARLNCEQREAVDCPEDTVVLAGPGSGKTDTLAVKIGRLFAVDGGVPSPRAVAAITYTRAAAAEIKSRVYGLGVRPRDQLVTGTVHSFCLHHIVRPFALLTGDPEIAVAQVATTAVSNRIRQEVSDAEGLPRTLRDSDLQRMRRMIACGEDPLDHFDEQQLRVAHSYETRLREVGLIDFDGIVHAALEMVSTHPAVVDVLASRFTWILVDEYQDLGGPLHHLVCKLRDHGGIRIFAVGDPDQTIFQFTGADPKYLNELEIRGWHPVRLRLNYRSGIALIKCAMAALGEDRAYLPAPELEHEGEAFSEEVPGGLSGQVEYIARELVPSLLQAGTPPEEVAILYPRRGWALDELCSALDGAEVPYSLEGDDTFPRSDLTVWLQRLAQFTLGSETVPQTRFVDLVRDLRELFSAVGRPFGEHELATAAILMPIAEETPDPNAPLSEWLRETYDALDLARHAAHPNSALDHEALDRLLAIADAHDALTLASFARPLHQPGRVVITTFHSSKGRQFDIVILPFLQEGIMPFGWVQWNGSVRCPSLNHDRLHFYVAFTRARQQVRMLWSANAGMNMAGDPLATGKSRFVVDVENVT